MENISEKPNVFKKILGGLKNLFRKKWFKVILVLVVLVVAAKVLFGIFGPKPMTPDQLLANQTQKSEKRNIEKILSSTGTVQPLNKYEVKSLVEGEVIAADFKAGDQVKKDDVLYKIASKSLSTKIKSAKNTVARAEEKYDRAVADYHKAQTKYHKGQGKLKDLNVTAKVGGVITELTVSTGDYVTSGVQIGKIYDNTYMLLTVPFNSADVSGKWVGKSAQVQIDESGENLRGTVTKVSSIKEALSGNRVVREVTIRVKNPGGITTTTVATASVGSKTCNNEGTFKAIEEKAITSDTTGKVKQLKVAQGSRVQKGSVLMVLTSDTVTDQIDSYQTNVDTAKNAVDDAKGAIDDAKLALQEQLNAATDFSITAPISGQIVRKDIKEGDTIKSTNTTNVLCVIYDLSALTFDMNIDELDIKTVQVGQKVDITADALSGVKITGVVTNISLESKTNNGVSQYPVTVRIDSANGLLPGMNVTGKIVVEKAENVVAIPAAALMRGDVVYVKDASVKKAVGEVPVGFRKVKVTTGISDGDFIEIKSGLKENVKVYVVSDDMSNITMSDSGGSETTSDDSSSSGSSGDSGSSSDGSTQE